VATGQKDYRRGQAGQKGMEEIMTDKGNIEQRMSELMEPIDQQIQMTDTREELLMIACAMMQRTREIFDSELGEDGRRKMFKDLAHG